MFAIRICVAIAMLAAGVAYARGSATTFGSGCGAAQPPTIVVSGTIAPGGLVTLAVGNVPPGATTYLIIGASNASSAAGPLPLPLPTPFGGGCALLVSPDLAATVPFVGASFAIPGTLPASLADIHLYMQALCVSPGTAVASAGLDIHVTLPTVTGIVALPGGAPVANARVTLFVPDLSVFAERRTDAFGAFAFEAVPAGTYRLGVAAKNYAYDERTLIIGAASTTQSFALQPETHPGAWSLAGSTAPELFDATDIGAYRPDGTILFCHDTTDPIVFDPETGTKWLGPASGTPQGCMNTTHLPDGGVMLAGGQNGSSPGDFTKAISWVKKFTTAGQWSPMPWMLAPTGRWYPGLARLADGRVLVFGGGTAPNAERTDTAEIFDPATATWTWTGSMGSKNEFAPSALLFTGKVLRTWGSAPELYDPAAGSWSVAGTMATSPVARGFPDHSDHSVVVLANGRALLVGVRGNPAAAMTESFNATTGAFTAGTSPDLKRYQCEIVQLPDGRIFVGAGDESSAPSAEPDVLGIVRRCDLLDPDSGAWRRMADMAIYREYHAITLLTRDARVLTTGGTAIKFQVGPTSTAIESWAPPYLFRGVRPQLTGLSDASPARGQTVACTVFPATALTSFVLAGLPTTTHWVDGGIPRRLVLPATQVGALASTTIPSDPNLVPLGWYFLFGMVDDIPSAAFIVNVGP